METKELKDPAAVYPTFIEEDRERVYQVFVAGREFCGIIDGGVEKPFLTLKKAAMIRRVPVERNKVRVELLSLHRDKEYVTNSVTFSTAACLFFELNPGTQTYELWKQATSVIQTASPAVLGVDGKPIGYGGRPC